MNSRYGHKPLTPAQSLSFFIVTVLGFSFWFLMVVPFATHRESYGWLASALTGSAAHQLSFGITSTYRPLAQIATWSLFRALDPGVFPTSVLRQALLQGLVYILFVVAWWLIFSAAPQRRIFAVLSFIAGGVFFSGYVHLFHLYGIFYVPVILVLGALLQLNVSGELDGEGKLGIAAIVLAFWHPFATALFVGFYFGFYLETFRTRFRSQHVRAILTLVAAMIAVAAVAIIFPRDRMPLGTKLLGFQLSYQTNEVNAIAAAVAFVLSCATIFSTDLSPRKKLAGLCIAIALGLACVVAHVPLLVLWLLTVFIKLIRMQSWSLFFLALTAVLLPFGGGVGTPIHALFAIIIAVYVTALGWHSAEGVLSSVNPRYLAVPIAALTAVVLMVRLDVNVPFVTKVANPLLVERERTYQLENALAWLHRSQYCSYDLDFKESAGSPVDSVENVITRKNRPPAALEDVQYYWNNVLRCRNGQHAGKQGTILVTFGGPALDDSDAVFVVKGKYAGDAIVWFRPMRSAVVALE